MSAEVRTTRQAETRSRRAERREAAARARERERRRRRALIAGVAAVAVLAVAVLVGLVVRSQRTSPSADAGDVAVPSVATEGGTAFAVGSPDAPVTVDVYEDFHCPSCTQFEEVAGDTLATMVDEGTIQLRYRPMSFLDRGSTDRYSTRAMNAAAVVGEEAGPEAYAAFHRALLENQPARGGAGLSDEELIEMAAEAGATGDAVAEGITGLRYEEWTREATEAASEAGVEGTPTVLVDGEPLAEPSVEGLTAAVAQAAG